MLHGTIGRSVHACCRMKGSQPIISPSLQYRFPYNTEFFPKAYNKNLVHTRQKFLAVVRRLFRLFL